MIGLLRRHGVLLLIALAMVGVYFQMSRPALSRGREMRALELVKHEELLRLREEARQMELQYHALRAQDPVLLERAVRARFLTGGDKSGLPEAPRPRDPRGS